MGHGVADPQALGGCSSRRPRSRHREWLLKWSTWRATALGADRIGQTIDDRRTRSCRLAGWARLHPPRYHSWILSAPADAAEHRAEPVAPGEVDAVLDLFERTFAEHQDRLPVPRAQWRAATVERPGFEPDDLLVIRVGDRPAAAAFLIDSGEVWVDKLAVAPEFRGHGFARDLLDAARSRATGRVFPRATVHGLQRRRAGGLHPAQHERRTQFHALGRGLVDASAESWEAITAGVDLQVRTRRWRTSMCGGHVPWRGVAAAMNRSHITITALVIGLLGAVAPSNAEAPVIRNRHRGRAHGELECRRVSAPPPALAGQYAGVVKPGAKVTLSGSMTYSLQKGYATNLRQSASLSGAPIQSFTGLVYGGTYPFSYNLTSVAPSGEGGGVVTEMYVVVKGSTATIPGCAEVRLCA